MPAVINSINSAAAIQAIKKLLDAVTEAFPPASGRHSLCLVEDEMNDADDDLEEGHLITRLALVLEHRHQHQEVFIINNETLSTPVEGIIAGLRQKLNEGDVRVTNHGGLPLRAVPMKKKAR